MSSQVVRVQGFSKGSLASIGNETERGKVEHRNADIDTSKSYLNICFKRTEQGFYHEWNDIKTSLNATYRDNKKAIAFEGMVITSNAEFFEKMGYKKGEDLPQKAIDFFKDSYKWALNEIGYNGTDKNVISAVVHLDETTPHLQLYYLPITDKWQKKVYAKDENGKVLRTEKGTPIQAKDDKGKTIFEIVENKQEPKLSRTEFWRVRGGQNSYSQMQDRFHEKVGKAYDLERGEVGSDKVHRTKNEWEKEQLLKEKEQLIQKVEPYRELNAPLVEIEHKGKSVLGLTTIKTKDLNVLKEQAKVFRLNQSDLLDVRAEKKRLAEAREILDETLVQAREMKSEYVQKYNDQLFLNQKLESAEDKISDLNAQIGDLRRENQKLREMVRSIEKSLKKALKTLKEVVQAVGLFKYGEGKFKINSLNDTQSKLIDIFANKASSVVRENGYTAAANDIDNKVKLSDDLKDELEPPRSRYDDWELEM